jgi:PRC-barrel domain
MNRLRVLAMVAGLCLGGAVVAQTQTTPGDPSATGSMPGPPAQGNQGTPSQVSPATSPEKAGSSVTPAQAGTIAKPQQRSVMRSATVGSGAQQVTSGMDVQSHAGQKLGTVADVVKGSSGDPTYVVIADQTGRDTAVPYSVARHMVQGTNIVIDDKRLQSAPKVPESQLQNPSITTWKAAADSYWSKQAKEQD